MDPRTRYKSAQTLAWTRVDMLLVIYDQAIAALNEGAMLLEHERTRELLPVLLRAQRAVLLIAEGLRLDQGDVPAQILRLCSFAMEQMRTQSAENWRSAARVLATVRDGFGSIQEDARAAEYNGLVPALDAVG